MFQMGVMSLLFLDCHFSLAALKKINEKLNKSYTVIIHIATYGSATNKVEVFSNTEWLGFSINILDTCHKFRAASVKNEILDGYQEQNYWFYLSADATPYHCK